MAHCSSARREAPYTLDPWDLRRRRGRRRPAGGRRTPTHHVRRSPLSTTIDLNADAGESFGAWRLGSDDRLFPLMSSVNLACGFHAGDPSTMLASVRCAQRSGVAIGAHPGLPDLVGFGRRDMAIGPDEVYADVLYQVGALQAFVRVVGTDLHHVKPHGALYLRMGRDLDVARAVAAAVYDLEPQLPLVVLAGPGGEVMRRAADEVGVRTVDEAFPDRAYLPDGALAGRSVAGAVIGDAHVAADRALRMVQDGQVEAVDGSVVELRPATLCVHGDNEEAIAIAGSVRARLEAAGVTVAPF